MTTETLITRIRTAFSGVERPAPDALTPHRCEECDELRDTYSQYAWEDLPADIIEENFGNLSLLSEVAWRYYLPAHLIEAVNGAEDDSLVYEFVIYSLASITEEGTPPFRDFSILSGEQLDVLSEFLDLVESRIELDIYVEEIAAARKNIAEASREGET